MTVEYILASHCGRILMFSPSLCPKNFYGFRSKVYFFEIHISGYLYNKLSTLSVCLSSYGLSVRSIYKLSVCPSVLCINSVCPSVLSINSVCPSVLCMSVCPNMFVSKLLLQFWLDLNTKDFYGFVVPRQWF
jgi:hypothetical protein